MVWHYILIGIVIISIICIQVRIFLRTKNIRKHLENIFPENSEDEWLVQKSDIGVQIISQHLFDAQEKKAEIEKSLSLNNKEQELVQNTIDKYEKAKQNATNDVERFLYVNKIIEQNEKRHGLKAEESELKNQLEETTKFIETFNGTWELGDNATRTEIIESINRYLYKNKNSVSDFNLIRDIIDRNCSSLEEEIQIQLPVPLYFGLIGTMLGILVGVGALVITGSLSNLLTSFEPPIGIKEGTAAFMEAKNVYDAQATQGIVSLFGGIALAMISSIVGILLTTIGFLGNKNTKANVERKKHHFFSWLQAELLPKISTDFSSALIRLGHDLSSFNNTFSSNANLLKQTISEISTATVAQSGLLNAIERLDIAHIAQANIVVYEQLKNCTEDIFRLSVNLKEIQSNIKGIGQYMENSINDYERRNTFIQDASGKVDLAIIEGQKKLTNGANDIFTKYDELLHTLYMRTEATTVELAKKYNEQTESLHKAIVNKLGDVKQLETELRNLVAVKTSITNLEKAATDQNRKIDNLTTAIRDLAQVKVNGGMTHIEMKMPTAYKVIIILASTVITISGLFFITLRVLSIFGITI
ncbi:MAG: hypothetical protein NC038_00035 [Paludibacter sp.]|nr:hypothetical protein [Bacteroidales bacterium]MCM1068772.1 hypothetical protein [Prevotella sp.]MCM1354484.1 hypothetical protein [Bacteroides sp.]MCM1443287.1 hypothetical protein [Muribaculum sp.]MCM1481028.1 hypothetical protein [Paludibacter sp.]